MIELVANALGVAVVQSFWQCTLIGTAAMLAAMQVKRASVRYGIWCVAMLCSIVWFSLTFVSDLRFELIADGGPHGAMLDVGVGVDERFGLFEYVAIAWAIGFVAVVARFGRQWFVARSLRVRSVVDADDSLISMFGELRDVIGVSRRVRVLVSEIAQSPMVVGWFVPVVVVPASVITMMGPEQVRLVLAHELAHIRRYDHFVNMLQVLVELVLFYHPVVWWMSRQARVEREHCCDDVAVCVAGDAVLFARALADLEEVRLRSRAVLGLHQGGSLMNRIQRILNGTDTRHSFRATAMLSTAILVVGTAYAYTNKQGEPVSAEVQEAVLGVELLERERVNDEKIDFLRRQVAAGALTREQAFELYRRVVEESYEQSLKEIESMIWSAVEAGKLSAIDGTAKIEGEREGIAWEIEHRFLVDVCRLPAGKAKLDLLTKKLKSEVAMGSLTREQAEAELDWVRETLQDRVLLHGQVVEGVPILESLPLVGHLFFDGPLEYKALLQKEMELLDGMVERGELNIEDAKPKYEGVLLKILPTLDPKGEQGNFEIELMVTPEGELTSAIEVERREYKAQLILELKSQKLTPMDELYWHHQGIRSLDAYDDEFSEDC